MGNNYIQLSKNDPNKSKMIETDVNYYVFPAIAIHLFLHETLTD